MLAQPESKYLSPREMRKQKNSISLFQRYRELRNAPKEIPKDLRSARYGRVRYGHTQNSGLLCGGRANCLQWKPDIGSWNKSHSLISWRYGHVSWNTPSGVYLIGGAVSPNTSELLKEDGSVVEGFALAYSTQ